jgi:hypothetical protein
MREVLGRKEIAGLGVGGGGWGGRGVGERALVQGAGGRI